MSKVTSSFVSAEHISRLSNQLYQLMCANITGRESEFKDKFNQEEKKYREKIVFKKMQAVLT